MTVSSINNKVKKISYPYLGESKREKSLTVLFTEDGCGTVMTCTDDSKYIVGYYSSHWFDFNFIPLPSDCSVTIT